LLDELVSVHHNDPRAILLKKAIDNGTAKVGFSATRR
jgi:hypothetical protein